MAADKLTTDLAIAIHATRKTMPHCAPESEWQAYRERLRGAVLAVAPELAADYWAVSNAADARDLYSPRDIGKFYATAVCRIRRGLSAMTSKQCTRN